MLAVSLSALILGALALVAVRQLDLALLVAAVGRAHVGWLLAATLVFLSILPLWAIQWRLIAPPVPLNTVRGMYGVVATSAAMHNTAAYFAGEAAGALLLVTRIGITRAAAASIIIMDQLLVGMAKLVVITIAATTIAVPEWMSKGLAVLALGVVLVLVGCLAGALKIDAIAVLTRRVAGERAARMVDGMGNALAPLLSPRLGGGALLLALLKKGIEVVGIVCMQLAFGEPASLATAVLILATLNLATLLPLVPGNLGVYEAAVALVYTSQGMAAEQAVAIAVVQHACYLTALALPGYVWLAATGASRSATAAS